MATNDVSASENEELQPDAPMVATSETAELHYFYEDEVLKFDRYGRVKFGLVMETYNEAGSSETESEYDDAVRKGEIRVAWHPEGLEEVIPAKLVSLIYTNKTVFFYIVVLRISIFRNLACVICVFLYFFPTDWPC